VVGGARTRWGVQRHEHAGIPADHRQISARLTSVVDRGQGRARHIPAWGCGAIVEEFGVLMGVFFASHYLKFLLSEDHTNIFHSCAVKQNWWYDNWDFLMILPRLNNILGGHVPTDLLVDFINLITYQNIRQQL
jgi:hypothetical protein